MPRYQYRCETCGDFDRIMRIMDHQRVIECACGAMAKQIITAPTIVIPGHMSALGVSSYESPVSGKIITNQRQRKNDMAESGCIEYEPGMKQDADRRVISDDIKLDKMVDVTVDKEIAGMSSDKRENFFRSVADGATVEPVRLTG